MSDAALNSEMQALLDHTGWVRALAQRLASGADADEIEQATWLAVFGTRSRRKTPLRQWLGAIVRNSARQQRRSRGRRAEHEELAARDEALPDTVDLLARAEVQRKLVAAVMELDEPYRTAVLLRYFEQLPPRSIAARLNQPLSTVHTHLTRGVERLRKRLDGEYGGDRNQWVAAFIPMLSALNGPLPGTGTLLMVNAKLVAAAVVLSAVGAVTWWLNTPSDVAQAEVSRVDELSPPSNGSASSAGASNASTELATRPAARSSVRSSELAESAITPAVATSALIRGRVLDAEGRMLRDAHIVARPVGEESQAPESSATSGADGSFVIENGPVVGTLESNSPQFATVMSSRFSQSTRDGLIVVLAARLELAGLVMDEHGTALAAAKLKLAMPDDLHSRFDVVLDRSNSLEWSASSDAQGKFVLEDVPRVEGAELVVSADGFEDWHSPAPQFSDRALAIVMSGLRATDGNVRGVVLDLASQPVPAAIVAFGLDTQRTGADGTFAFKIDNPEGFGRRVGVKPTKLMALAEGFLPAIFEPQVEDGAPVWPAQVTLRLASQALSISGRVVDAEGEPLTEVRVYVADATLLGAVDGRPALLETAFSSGGGLWKFVETNAEGEFVLTGLLERDYVVRAHQTSSLLRVDSEPTPAGSAGLVLRLPTDEVYPLVAGRILSLSGTPISGASIHPMCDALQIKHEGRTITTSHDAVEGALTGEDGRFELHNVPMDLVYLRVDGEQILPVEYGRYVEGDARFASSSVRELPRESIADLEIRVEARCHLQVELDQVDKAEELAVLNADGDELTISLYSATGRKE